MNTKKQNKTKLKLFLLVSGIIFGTISVPVVYAASTGFFDYKLLEGIPGFFSRGQSLTDLPTLISAIYKFGIWTVGIAAMFMLIVGGFMYMASAGNKATAGNAKGVITDALLGLAVALLAWLFLYVINPDLTKIRVNTFSVEVKEIPTIAPSGTGNCKSVVTKITSPCTPANLKLWLTSKSVSGINIDTWAEQASKICNAESGGEVDAASGGKCSGTSIAWGLFQINLNAHCPGAFEGTWNRTRAVQAGGTKLNDPGCKVKDTAIFEKCKTDAIDANKNLSKMWSLYTAKGGWGDWEANSLWCKF